MLLDGLEHLRAHDILAKAADLRQALAPLIELQIFGAGVQSMFWTMYPSR